MASTCVYMFPYVCLLLPTLNPYALDEKREATEPAPSPAPAAKKPKKRKETPPASKSQPKEANKKASSSGNNNSDPEEVDPSAKIKRDMKRKRKSMTKHKKILTKKDKSLPKVVPKDELTVTETAFVSRLVSRTRSWINEVTPGVHINTSTQPNAPTFVPNINTPHNTTLPHLKTPSSGDAKNFIFLQLGSKGRSPSPYQAPSR